MESAKIMDMPLKIQQEQLNDPPGMSEFVSYSSLI